MNNSELKLDRIRMVKRFLAENGINVYQKDIATVERHGFPIRSDDGGIFDHREIYLVVMKDGKKYEILRETVDAENKFSTGSARMITREIREQN